MNQPECADNDKARYNGNIDESVLDPTLYSSREEYIEKAGSTIAALCQAANFKWPSIVFAQMFWEGGISYSNGQCTIGNIGTKDHALFGIKQAGENQDEWPYWDGGVGQAHSDGGNARAYSCFSNSIFDYIDWLCRNNGNGNAKDGHSYNSYAAAANAGSSGQDGLSNLLSMGYCPNDYSPSAFATASNITMWDDKVSVSGEPKSTKDIGRFEAAKTTGSSTSAMKTGSSGSTEAIGDTIEEKIWNCGKSLGLSDEACAAILGNGYQESGLDPTCTASDGAYGIWQFTGGHRTEFEDWCSKNGKKMDSGDAQLEFGFGSNGSDGVFKGEWSTHLHQSGYYFGDCGVPSDIDVDNTWEDFIKETDIEKATYSFMCCYERCADDQSNYGSVRLPKAKEYYEQFKGTGGKTNATEESEACSNKEGTKTTYGNAGIEQGEKYHQGQGSHYNGSDERTFGSHSAAAGSGCGAYAFTVCVNMLIGEVHKFCGGEVFDDIGGASVSTRIGWGEDASDALKSWLKKNGLENTIDIGLTKVNSADEMQKALSEQKLIIISNGSGYTFTDNTGNDDHYSDGHFIMFYKCSNGTFYANDSWGYEDKFTGAQYTAEKVDELIKTSGGQLQVWRKS